MLRNMHFYFLYTVYIFILNTHVYFVISYFFVFIKYKFVVNFLLRILPFIVLLLREYFFIVILLRIIILFIKYSSTIWRTDGCTLPPSPFWQLCGCSQANSPGCWRFCPLLQLALLDNSRVNKVRRQLAQDWLLRFNFQVAFFFFFFFPSTLVCFACVLFCLCSGAFWWRSVGWLVFFFFGCCDVLTPCTL